MINRMQKTDGWKMVPAISDSRLYYIEADWLMRPGPRLVNAYEQLARTIHPQLFKEPLSPSQLVGGIPFSD